MIGTAIQKHKTVLVFNEKGNLIFSKIGTLQNITSLNVSIRYKNKLLIFDAKGKLKYSKIISRNI